MGLSAHIPFTRPTPAQPTFRVAKIDSTRTLALAGASDQNSVGFTAASIFAVGGLVDAGHPDSSIRMLGRYEHYGSDGPILEAASGASIQPGVVVFQASSGRISHSGTVRVGVANELYGHPWPTAEARFPWSGPGPVPADIVALRAAWSSFLTSISGLELWSVIVN